MEKIRSHDLWWYLSCTKYVDCKSHVYPKKEGPWYENWPIPFKWPHWFVVPEKFWSLQKQIYEKRKQWNHRKNLVWIKGFVPALRCMNSYDFNFSMLDITDRFNTKIIFSRGWATKYVCLSRAKNDFRGAGWRIFFNFQFLKILILYKIPRNEVGLCSPICLTYFRSTAYNFIDPKHRIELSYCQIIYKSGCR